MSGFKTAIVSAAVAAASLCAVGGAALANPVTENGETIGLALGAPLPEGVYFLDTASYISRSSKPELDAFVNIPVVAYSSPLKVLGGRVEGYVAIPQAAVGVADTTYKRAMYNPAALGGLAWDLGNGWGFSNFVGGYAPVDTEVGDAGLGGNFWTFNERAALSYTANNWNLTAHAIYGTSGHDLKTKKQVQADYLNVDLTATKTFGKWELGLVGYTSADLSSSTRNTAGKQSQFAAGPLVGYNLGAAVAQAYVTQGLGQSNYGGTDTTGWLRFTVPLWNPAP